MYNTALFVFVVAVVLAVLEGIVIAPRSPKITSVNYPLQLIYFSFWKKDGRRNRD